MARKNARFLRTQWFQVSCLGKRRKKKLKYRKATGIDNKIRLKMKGHLRNVSIGFRNEKKKRGLINGLAPVCVHNINDIKKLDKNEIGILSNIGKKKRTEVANYIIENKIRLLNFNPVKFLEKIRKELEELREEKLSKSEKKKEEEKRREEIQKKKEEEEKKAEEKKGNIEEKVEEKVEEEKKGDKK